MINIPIKDPVKRREYNKLKWLALKNDPIKYNEYIQTQRLRSKKWCEDNPNKVKIIQENYREKNRDKIRQKQLMKNVSNQEKRREQRNKASIKMRFTLKKKYVDMLGGKCSNEWCGYDKTLAGLDFHHINPKDKEKEFDYRLKNFGEKIKEGKIKLLCATCHREEHWKMKEKEILNELGLI